MCFCFFLVFCLLVVAFLTRTHSLSLCFGGNCGRNVILDMSVVTSFRDPLFFLSLKTKHNQLYIIYIYSVSNLRAHLAAAVPPSDQILLLGPPYKVPKDATLQSEEILNALRLGDLEDDDLIPNNENITTTTSTTTLEQAEQQQTPDATTTTETAATTAPSPLATTRTTPPTITFAPSSSSGGGGNKNNKILAASERTGARRLFLFSKRALSETSPKDTTICSLQPREVKLPTEPPGPSPLNIDMSSSTATLPPLHQALTAYERQFMLYLAQGRAFADGADLRLAACRTCVQEQAVIARALRAAVSNLADHYHTATRTRAEFTASFQSKLAAHGNLLRTFENILSQLATISLHSSLVSIARSSGRVLETLLDTVPVEKERSWSQQCALGHERLDALFGELETAFGELGTTASREEEATKDRQAEEEVQMLWNLVEGQMKHCRDAQSQRLERLTADHSDVVKTIMHALDSENRDDEERTQAAFGPLGEKSKSSKDVIPAMIKDDAIMKEVMEQVEQAKTRAMQRMKVRLKEISRTQSNIQRVLSNVVVVRDAMNQQMENMTHLEHLAELPDSYRAFLSEIRRRRAYGQAVHSQSLAMVERLAALRADEVKAREKFLRGPGRHLMPPFFDLFAPTLATPPPLFTPQMPSVVELDTLPDVGPEDVVSSSSAGGGGGVGTVEMPDAATTTGGGGLADTEMLHHHPVPPTTTGGIVSTASSLTAESHPIVTTTTTTGVGGGGGAQPQPSSSSSLPQQQQQISAGSSGGVDAIMASARQTTSQLRTEEEDISSGQAQAEQEQMEPQQQQPQDQLIVSADDHSGEGIVFDPAEGAAVEAKAKTLAYENAVLRQTIERLGGKPPRAYLEEAVGNRNVKGSTSGGNSPQKDDDKNNNKEDTSKSVAAANVEIAALRKELVKANAKVVALEESLTRAQSDYAMLASKDKISHRSFDVGDVGLFMLASRGGGKDGKPRTYLAFHTNCPHRYLSKDCVTGEPNFVVGRIVLIDEWMAMGDVATETNPYGLPPGTKFWVVTVEVLSSY